MALLKHKLNQLLPHPGYNKGEGTSTTNTVQKSDPWAPIQPYLLEGAQAASNLYNASPGGTQPYPGQQMALLPDWMQNNILSGINSASSAAPYAQSAMWNALAPALNPQATGYQSVNANAVTPGSVDPAQMGFAQIQGSGINANPAINQALYGNGMSPFLDSMANSLVNKTQQAWGDTSRGIYDQLNETVLPGIEDQFNQAGQLGQSRQALSQGTAIGKTNDALAREYGDMSTNLMGQLSNLYGGVYENAQNRSASLASQMAGLGSGERLAQANMIQQMLGQNAGFSQDAAMANLNAYMQSQLANQGADMQGQLANQGAGLNASQQDLAKLSAQMQASGMIPGISQYPLSLNNSLLQAYSPLMSQEQGLYDIAKNQYYEGAQAPWNMLGQYASLINPAAGQGGTTTGSNTVPTYSSPVGQTLSAALPLAAMFLSGGLFPSDRRLKTDIEPVGKTPGGLNLYRYKYVWGGPTQVGVMADEVKKVLPEAVVNVAGYDTVNYRMIR